MRNKNNYRKWCVDILADIAGGIFIAVGAYNFAAAAAFPLVGLNGIALIFHHLMGLPIGAVAMALNVPVAALCYKTLGRGYFLRSLRTIVITSVIMDFVAPLFPVYRGDALLAAVCTGVLSGVGYALIYMRDSSTGGTDFIIMSIKALRPHLTIGNISFALEAIIILAGTLAVSRQVDALIYGLMISFLMSAVIDRVMYGISSGKMTLIVSDYPVEIAERICEVTDRGATFLNAEGSYGRTSKKVVMCACSNKQMYLIKHEVKKIDPEAFFIVLESNEVVGEGFKTA